MMSSMRVIVTKMSTRWPSGSNRLSSLSSTTILPQLATMCSPSMKGGPGSAPSKRYGWLHTLRRCMTMFCACVEPLPPRPSLSVCRSRMSTLRYHCACIGTSGRKSLVSFLGGMLFSTWR